MTMAQLEQAGKEAVMRMSPQDKALFDFINSKIIQCALEIEKAAKELNLSRVITLTLSYKRLLGQAYDLGSKYPVNM